MVATKEALNHQRSRSRRITAHGKRTAPLLGVESTASCIYSLSCAGLLFKALECMSSTSINVLSHLLLKLGTALLTEPAENYPISSVV